MPKVQLEDGRWVYAASYSEDRPTPLWEKMRRRAMFSDVTRAEADEMRRLADALELSHRVYFDRARFGGRHPQTARAYIRILREAEEYFLEITRRSLR